MLKLEDGLKLQKDMMGRYSDFYEKMLKFNQLLTNPPDIKTGQTPAEIVYRKHKVKLLRYLPAGDKVYKTPILLSYAMINKPYIMDLLPGRSVVEVLVKSGFDVFLIDWGSPTKSDSNKGLDEYVNFYMDRVVNKVIELSGESQINLLGYCMGGTMTLLYTALHQKKIKNLITMATPFDCTSNEGLLYQWSKEFPVDEVREMYGNCPGWLLANSFVLLKPVGNIEKAVGLYKGILKDSYVTLFLAMEEWLRDTIDVPGKVYTEFITDWFQNNLLIKNEVVLGGKKVDFKKIKCPYLNLIAEEDSTIPPPSSKAIGDYISSEDKKLMTVSAGHIGLAVSGKAIKKLWPEAVKWIGDRSGEMVSIEKG